MQFKIAIIVFILILSGCSKPDPHYDAIVALEDYQTIDPKQDKQLQLFMSYPLEERFRLHHKMYRRLKADRWVGITDGFSDRPADALKYIIYDLGSKKTDIADFYEYYFIIDNLEKDTNIDICKDEYIKPLRKILYSYNLSGEETKVLSDIKFKRCVLYPIEADK